jgi:hypothetical protein
MNYQSNVRKRARYAVVIICLWISASVMSGAPASEDPENFKVEVSGAAWLVDSSGTIQASGTPIDLVTDLGAEQQQPTFYGPACGETGPQTQDRGRGNPFPDQRIQYREPDDCLSRTDIQRQ